MKIGMDRDRDDRSHFLEDDYGGGQGKGVKCFIGQG